MADTIKDADSLIKVLQKLGFDKIKKESSTLVHIFIDKKNGKDIRKDVLMDLSNALGASYLPQKTGPGWKSSVGAISVKKKFIILAKKMQGEAGLKPSDIKPKIVDTWLEAEEIVDNTKKYLDSIDLPKTTKDTLIQLLDKTLDAKAREIDVTGLDPTLAPSEFYEILTSVRLAKLMKKDDPKIREILGIKDKKIKLSNLKIKINIPQKANMPLLDYEISMSASNNPEDATMKISVKSKVKGKETNTIKFKDAFKDVREVNDWYNSLSSSVKRTQIGQKSVSETAVSAPRGNSMLFPTVAVSKLITKNPSLMNAVIDSFTIPKGVKRETIKSAIKTLADKIYSVSNKQSELRVILEDNELKEFTAFMKANLLDRSKNPVKNISVGNAGFMCEKILERAAEEKSKSNIDGLNFYNIFYDQILKSRKIAYAVAKKTGSKQSSKIKYDFFSLVNWEQEYGNWIALRSKNSIDSQKDTLGMDIREYNN